MFNKKEIHKCSMVKCGNCRAEYCAKCYNGCPQCNRGYVDRSKEEAKRIIDQAKIQFGVEVHLEDIKNQRKRMGFII